MILQILLALAPITILGFVVAAARQPADFIVSRRLIIDAPVETVFAFVNDLRQHERWSPFMQLDPEMVMTYSGTPSGMGASQHWKGNRRAGEGRMTVIDSDVNERVGFRLEFLKPFQVVNQAEFTFVPQTEGTLVTWNMTGHRNFLFKAMSLFMDCDKMCGPMFEKGLAQLKTLSEEAASLTLVH